MTVRATSGSRRRGDQIHGAFSLDGDHWTPFPPMVANLEDRLEIGVVAVSSSSTPLTAEFEGFKISARPAASGDARTGAINP